MIELLEQIADYDPMTIAADESACCFYCGSGESVDHNVTYWLISYEMYMHPVYVRHADDCLWIQVRAAANRDANTKQYLPGQEASLNDWEVEDLEELLAE